MSKTALRSCLDALSGPWAAVMACGLMVAAFLAGGEAALIAAACVVPLVVTAVVLLTRWTGRPDLRDNETAARRALEDAWDRTAQGSMRSAVFAVHFDDAEAMTEHHGPRVAQIVAQRLTERVRGALRWEDVVTQTQDGLFIVLAAHPATDLEACIQMCARMQTAAEEPVVADGVTFWASVTIGFCLRSRAPGPDAASWRGAAETALAEARRIAPGTIRGFTPEIRAAHAAAGALTGEIAEALEAGHVQPWFQPQISTETGRVSGFEALARWVHPARGVLYPEQFLPAALAAGHGERLGEVILYHTLTAMKAWDAAGAQVPSVGVNLSHDELRNPNLARKIAWELDRFDLEADRLAVEVAEQALTAEPDEVIRRNLAALADLGCRIDMDDFGTASASIAAIRRFRIGRIKIDEGLISKADRDPEQQRLVSAILTMAERLQVRTLAEGVQTVGEHALLAQLGCDDVQGFGIGRPMPFEQTLTWMKNHDAKLQDAPVIGPNGPPDGWLGKHMP